MYPVQKRKISICCLFRPITVEGSMPICLRLDSQWNKRVLAIPARKVIGMRRRKIKSMIPAR